MTATPNIGYTFTQWSGDASGTHDTVTITVDTTKNVTALFAIKTYQLTINATNGSVTRNPTGTTFDSNTVVTLVAIPDPGYTFTSWSGDASGTNATTTVTMNAAKTVTATFTIKKFTLTISAANGAVTTSPSGTSFDSNTVVTLTAVPNMGYTFTGWSGAASGTNATTMIIMNSAKTVIASFDIKKYTLATNTGADVGTVTGNVTGDPDATLYDSGTVVCLTPPVDNKYTFTGWSGGATGSANPLSVTMTGNKTITANYAIKTYTLTVTCSPTAGGSVSASPASGPYNHGTSVTLTATANSGYHFTAWSGDASGTTSPSSVVMDGNKSVTATFGMDVPVVTTHPSSQTVLCGQDVSFSVVASGVSLSYQWQRNGADIGAATSATYTLSPARDGDNGVQFRCIVSNAGGKDTSNASTLTVNPVGMKLLSAGQFTMGENSFAVPMHTVNLSAFWIDSTEVTLADYIAYTGVDLAGGSVTDHSLPAAPTSWFDAVLYCNARSKANGLDTVYSYTGKTMTGNNCTDLQGLTINLAVRGFRLPTEAQWEYACRAVTMTTYWWGSDTTGMGARAWTWRSSPNGLHPVNTRTPNAWHLYDMAGNAKEWCNDWLGDYSSSTQTDPSGPTTGTYRVVRGGSGTTEDFFSNLDSYRSADRGGYYMPTIAYGFIGLRCVLAVQ